jgi:TctA family transporter
MLELLHYKVLFPWLLGMVFGIFVGATPGLTATMAVALIVPLSIKLGPTAGLALIIGVSFTAIFAGDIPATFLRIPGTPASAAATLDGHALAKKGRGGLAMSLDLFCSSIGGLVGVALLIFSAQWLAKFALQFSNFEMFWLGVLGLSLSAVVTQGSTFKGMIAAVLGLLIATVGLDSTSGVTRYSFGLIDLSRSTDEFVIPAMIGLFGLSEVLRSVRRPAGALGATVAPSARLPLGEALRTIWRYKRTVLQSAGIGTVIGALPGAGADIAAWGAYGIARKTSRRPDEFGTGSEEGVVAPTSANNAAVAGAWIPALVFGVPGDAVTAIVLGALIMYGITPGPNIFQDSGEQVQQLFAIAVITQFLLLPAGYLGIKAFSVMLRLPRAVVLSAVVLFSVVGAYAVNNNMFDVYVMVAFGLLGFFLESRGVPMPPLVLGLILGGMIETKLRAGLIMSRGDPTPFFTRPICIALIVVLVAVLAGGPFVRLLSRRIFRRSAV